MLGHCVRVPEEAPERTYQLQGTLTIIDPSGDSLATFPNLTLSVPERYDARPGETRPEPEYLDLNFDLDEANIDLNNIRFEWHLTP